MEIKTYQDKTLLALLIWNIGKVTQLTYQDQRQFLQLSSAEISSGFKTLLPPKIIYLKTRQIQVLFKNLNIFVNHQSL